MGWIRVTIDGKCKCAASNIMDREYLFKKEDEDGGPVGPSILHPLNRCLNCETCKQLEDFDYVLSKNHHSGASENI
jgi:hypothetical protein